VAPKGSADGSREVGMAIRLAISVEVLSVERGIWCDACALSSAARVWFTTTTNDHATLRSKTVCAGPECA
jgi:hypothetical protein